MALSGEQFEITAGDHSATVTEVGAALRRYAVGGVDITAPFAEDAISPGGCGAVLVPWPNRLDGGAYEFDGHRYQLPIDEIGKANAIHGLSRWVRWQRVGGDGSSVTLATDIVPRPGWPFEIRVEVSYALDASAGLAVTVRATNSGDEAAPFGAGFHPYLALRGHKLDEVSLRVPATTRLITNQAQIPLGARPVEDTSYDLTEGEPLQGRRFDDGFTDLTDSTAAVITPSGGAEIWWGDAFRYLQVFTNQSLAGVPAVAVEPMTCPANAFNSGESLIILDPEATWTANWGIRPI